MYCEMITRSRVNICPHKQLQMFFLAINTFKIYFLSNFQISSAVLLTIVTMLHVASQDLFFFITGNWTF